MCNVVYLDDEPDLCEVFSDLFSSPEISVRTFSDPKKAVEEIRKSTPNVVFLDYRLPGINGDEVASLLEESIPKYLITADFEVATKSYFVDKLLKPYDVDKITEIIKSHCKL